ncbi:MAG: GrpB family protein [Paenisporosarcina sp.]
MVEHRKDLWNDLLYFRDYLNSNVDASAEYKKIKLDFVQQNSGGILAYTHYKEEFVKTICSKRNHH